MSIKRKVFGTLLIMIVTLLLFSYGIMYILFEQVMTRKIKDYQNTVVRLNQNLIGSFIDSLNQITLLLSGDEALGTYLSANISDTLTGLQIGFGIKKQFSNYLSQPSDRGMLTYKSTLFLNDSLPIASSFAPASLTFNSVQSYSVCSNQEVKNSDWYQKTLHSDDLTHIFINQESNELCYSKKIQNTYYTGPYKSDGLGVVVIRVPIDKLKDILPFTPITPGSFFVLLQEDGQILYQSNDALPAGIKEAIQNPPSPAVDEASSSLLLSLSGKQYLSYQRSFQHELTLIFLTPTSDIRNQALSTANVYVNFALFFLLLATILAYVISCRLTRPIIRFSESIEKIDDTRTFDLSQLKVSDYHEIKVLFKSFCQLIAHTNQLFQDVKEREEQRAAYELQALQAQINPHFIYNAMDTVGWLALEEGNDEIANVVSSISNLMRYSINQPDKMVSLSQELGNIREFISIFQLRFDNKIKLDIETPLSPEEILIPKFIVQPLVENSILHGDDDPSTSIAIRIVVKQERSHTTIEIKDSGKGCDPELLNRYLAYEPVPLTVTNGFGIRNVNERIKLKFQGDCGLSYYNDDHGCLTARIDLDFSAGSACDLSRGDKKGTEHSLS